MTSQDEDIEAAREGVACPDCTANRGEHCRDRDGQPVEQHPRRLEVHLLDRGRHTEGESAPQTLGTVTAYARGTVTKGKSKGDKNRQDESEDGDGNG